MTRKTYQLETVSCPRCIAKIEGMLKRTVGIGESEVLFNTSRVKVAYDEEVVSSEAIRDKIEKLGGVDEVPEDARIITGQGVWIRYASLSYLYDLV